MAASAAQTQIKDHLSQCRTMAAATRDQASQSEQVLAASPGAAEAVKKLQDALDSVLPELDTALKIANDMVAAG